MLHFVLRLAGLERFGEVAPETVKSRIRHLEEAAHIRAAVSVEEVSGLLRVPVSRRLSVAIAGQHIECDERVEQVGDAARMKAELALQLARGQRFAAQGGEHAELDGRKQGLRRPETHSDLHQTARVPLSHVLSLSSKKYLPLTSVLDRFGLRSNQAEPP